MSMHATRNGAQLAKFRLKTPPKVVFDHLVTVAVHSNASIFGPPEGKGPIRYPLCVCMYVKYILSYFWVFFKF